MDISIRGTHLYYISLCELHWQSRFHQHTELVTNVGIKDFPGDSKITCSNLVVSVEFDPAISRLSVNYLTFSRWAIACADTLKTLNDFKVVAP